MSEQTLCTVDEIPEGEAREVLGGEAFVVRHAGRLFAYRNSCPHVGVPLNWQPDDFLAEQPGLLRCASHGALFRIEDGSCVSGPCAGRGLTAIPIRIDQGRVVAGTES